MSSHADYEPHTRYHEGNSPAAWWMVGIIIFGSVVVAAGFIVAQPWLAFVGCGVIVAGLVVGKLLAMAGLGNMPSYDVQEPAHTSAEGADRGPDGKSAS